MIQVSFKQEELHLLDEIEKRCQYIKQSDWMKQAAAEKIAREESVQNTREEPQQEINIDGFLDGF